MWMTEITVKNDLKRYFTASTQIDHLRQCRLGDKDSHYLSHTTQGQLCPVSQNRGSRALFRTTQGQPCPVSHALSHTVTAVPFLTQHRGSCALFHTTQGQLCPVSHNTGAAVPCLTQGQLCPVSHKDSHALTTQSSNALFHTTQRHALFHTTQRWPFTVPCNTKTAVQFLTWHRDSHALSHTTQWWQVCAVPCNKMQRQSCAIPHNRHTALHRPTQNKSKTVIRCPTQHKDSWRSSPKRQRVRLKQTCRLAAQWQGSTKPRWNKGRRRTAQKEGRWLLSNAQSTMAAISGP